MKMEKKIKISYLFIAFITLFFVSCNDDDTQIFNETPSNRVDQRVNELTSLLVGEPNGYKAVYFTKNDQRGGFTLFMKFNADGTVRQTSDFDQDINLANSSYEVSLGSAVELVFTTRNHITKGTDPETVVDVINGRRAPQGFYGTSVFQYFSNDNGVLTFRDIRNRDTASLVLTPTNFTDFDTESIASINESLANRISFTSVNCEIDNVFFTTSLVVDSGDSPVIYNLNYDEERFFAKPSRLDDIGSLEVTEEFGIAFTDDGLQISPALELNGDLFENFTKTFNNGQFEYVSTANGISVKILKVSSPPSGEDIQELPGGVFFYDTAYGTNPLLSPCFRELVIGEINNKLDARFGPGVLSFSFYAVFLNFEDVCSNLAIWVQDASGNDFRANYCISASIDDNKLFFDYLGPFTGANDAFLEAELQPMIDFFSGSEGLLYTNEGPFRASISNFTDPAGAFTNLNNPSLRAYGLFF